MTPEEIDLVKCLLRWKIEKEESDKIGTGATLFVIGSIMIVGYWIINWFTEFWWFL